MRAFNTVGYTIGPHVVLADAPERMQHGVLDHELAHIASVADMGTTLPSHVAPTNAPAERTAATVASGATSCDRHLASPGTIHRFGSEEHKSLGAEASHDALSDVNIGSDAKPEYLTFGETVALAGDYFGSVRTLRDEASTPQGRLRVRWAKWSAIDRYHGGAEPAISEAEKTALRNQYFELAGKNVSHFSAGGTAGATYAAEHTEALHLAFIAGFYAASASRSSSSLVNVTPALTQEAFAQHYLSDMFAGGHVRTERIAIKDWYAKHMPDTKNQFVGYMASMMHRYFVSKHPYANFVGLVPSEVSLQTKILTMGGPALDAFTLGDIVSLGYHNIDNAGLHVISDADAAGTAVAGGYKWFDVGDGHLASSPTTRGMALSAMRASLQEVDAMVTAGQNAAGMPNLVVLAPEEEAFATAIKGFKPFAALKYIPRIDTGSSQNKPMLWQWGSINQWLYAAIDDAVQNDIADQIAAIGLRRTDADERAGLADFVGVLRAIGIHALEQAVGSPARGTPAGPGP
ncbi:MAG: hypothetical protein NVSMB5_18700 [Candidatus Velthaea sp.]